MATYDAQEAADYRAAGVVRAGQRQSEQPPQPEHHGQQPAGLIVEVGHAFRHPAAAEELPDQLTPEHGDREYRGIADPQPSREDEPPVGRAECPLLPLRHPAFSPVHASRDRRTRR